MKKILLSIIALTAMFAAHAQVYVSSTTAGEGIDTVTVGSRMGYQVTPDATIAAMTTIMDPSVFKWTFSNSASVRKADGSGVATATTSPAGYFNENNISAVMPTSTGDITLKAIERSIPKADATLGCEGNEQSLTIRVIAKAKIDFTGTLTKGSCSAADYSLPLSLTGFGPWKISYTISFNSGAPVTYNVTIGAISNKPGTTPLTTLTLDIPTAQLSSGVGSYTVTLTNVLDRFADKSLDKTLVAATATELPSSPFNLYIYPTPTTSPIQHIRNL
jgi:hypothetical protein